MSMDLYEMFASPERRARDARYFAIGPTHPEGTVGNAFEYVSELLPVLIESGHYATSPDGLCQLAGRKASPLQTGVDILAALSVTHPSWKFDVEQAERLGAIAKVRFRELEAVRREYRAVKAAEVAERQTRAHPDFRDFKPSDEWRRGYIAARMANLD